MRRDKGFTLIELLIVVAIIAILALIAVPNFIEAQVRAKVSRAKEDIRSLATALEAYTVDWSTPPFDGYRVGAPPYCDPPYHYYWYVPDVITTPVSYIASNMLIDPFRNVADLPDYLMAYIDPPWSIDGWRRYRYTMSYGTWGGRWAFLSGRSTDDSSYLPAILDFWGLWRLNSSGPDHGYGPTGWKYPDQTSYMGFQIPYDPTNGTVSYGDVIRTQKRPEGA